MTIDANKLVRHLYDWAFAEAPTGLEDRTTRRFTEYDVQAKVYDTIQLAIKAVSDLTREENDGVSEV